MVESVRLQPLVSPVWPGGANRLAGALGSGGRDGPHRRALRARAGAITDSAPIRSGVR
jgi:hypothetical protein